MILSCLTTLSSLTWLASAGLHRIRKYSWMIHYLGKRLTLLHIDLCIFSDVHPSSKLLKASRVRPEAVTWGQRSARSTVATCQLHDAAGLGSLAWITGITQQPWAKEPGGLHRLYAHPYAPIKSLFDHNKYATTTVLILLNRTSYCKQIRLFSPKML